MIRLIAFAAFALAVATSAQAMSPPPLHQPDGISAEAGFRGRYGGYHRHGRWRYCCSVFRGYGYGGYRGYGYRGYRPYGYGVARHQVRRCVLWSAGHVCRKWVY